MSITLADGSDIIFLAKNIAVLIVVLAASVAAGTAVLGRRDGLALRAACGVAICAHACFLLASTALLRPAAILMVLAAVAVACAVRTFHDRRAGGGGDADAPHSFRTPGPLVFVAAVAVLGAIVLALYPPYAFDETLYHLPFIHALARAGELQFFADLRFPVFPVLQELLGVAAFFLGGEVAPHFVSLAELLILGALLIAWGDRYAQHAGALAVALLIGSPLIVQLGTCGYVDIALALFVAAGAYALDTRRYLLAGFFLGSACSVKYLGFYFAAAVLLFVLFRQRHRLRSAAAYLGACVAAALPTTTWIAATTGDPLFPFLRDNVWKHEATFDVSAADRVLTVLRLTWDVTFARERVGLQPPVTPFLLLVLLLLVAAAFRNANARWVLLTTVVYVAIFTYLPRDPRYLVSLLPLICLVGAVVLARRWPRSIVWIAIAAAAPGLAYGAYRVTRQGVPPMNPASTREWAGQRLPGYRALLLAGEARVYGCGVERLKSYAGGELVGDFTGPFRYQQVLEGAGTGLGERLRSLDAQFLLVAKGRCPMVIDHGGMKLVHEDDAVQLWRVF